MKSLSLLLLSLIATHPCSAATPYSLIYGYGYNSEQAKSVAESQCAEQNFDQLEESNDSEHYLASLRCYSKAVPSEDSKPIEANQPEKFSRMLKGFYVQHQLNAMLAKKRAASSTVQQAQQEHNGIIGYFFK